MLLAEIFSVVASTTLDELSTAEVVVSALVGVSVPLDEVWTVLVVAMLVPVVVLVVLVVIPLLVTAVGRGVGCGVGRGVGL